MFAATFVVRTAVVVCAALSATAVVAANGLPPTLRAPDRTIIATKEGQPIEFRLTDQDGRSFQFESLRGHAVLVFFGFTNCPNVCPPTMQKLLQVRRSLGESEAKLATVFISVDGARDTPEAVKHYLSPAFPGFIGLTGDPKAVSQIAARFPAVFFKGLPTDDAGGYNVEHSSQVYLVDRSGRLSATFYNAPAEDMTEITRRVIDGST